MNVASPVWHWATELRNLAAGATIAVFILVPSGQPAVQRAQSRANEHCLEMVTSIPDGFLDPRADLFRRTALFRTPTGLETAYRSGGQSSDDEEEEEDALLPGRLREVSGLPVTMLAQLAGVSKVTYHNWLKGEGVSETNLARLAGLRDILRDLHELRGAGLGDFLTTASPLGRPLELLQRGDTKLVLGLALRPARVDSQAPVVADTTWEASGLQGWIQPVASLGWGAPRLTDEELQQALLEVNPRPWTGAELAMDERDESPFVAHVRFVG